MTIQEYVKTTTNANEYGHSFYKTPSNEMLMKKIPMGLSSKEKNFTFAEQIQKKKAWVPGPIYNREIDWKTNIPKNKGQFMKSARNTFTDDIFIRSKFKEKSVVGPSHYNEDKQWNNKSSQKKPTGNYKFGDKRASFIEQPSHQLLSPSPDKYKSVNMDLVNKN